MLQELEMPLMEAFCTHFFMERTGTTAFVLAISVAVSPQVALEDHRGCLNQKNSVDISLR
jgi:hypothetical protein